MTTRVLGTAASRSGSNLRPWPGIPSSASLRMVTCGSKPAAVAGTKKTPGWSILVLAVLILIALLRIVSTYHVFNHTIDEGAHLACGIEWFANAYTYDPKHTPIARISIALLPFLDGLRLRPEDSSPAIAPPRKDKHRIPQLRL